MIFRFFGQCSPKSDTCTRTAGHRISEMAEGRFRPSLDELLWKGAAGENFFAICLGCVTMGCGAGFL